MELVEFHFSARLDFTGQSPGWCEVENLPGFSIGKALDHAEEITKKENRRKRKSQTEMVRDREYDSMSWMKGPDVCGKIGNVACDHGESMYQRGRSKQTVHDVHVEPSGLGMLAGGSTAHDGAAR